ncbi:cellulose biosynthesis cyclic di-GMP-binding regulatory protein BcsB, partial [Pantoea agglomerans]|uniref:cellulose biosynthesis cyclic di-GMP-binding regulatory protein BcsB n=1 Tax=Enterobacter agglomerans TaxID=549 RepID=UPI001A8F3BEF
DRPVRLSELLRKDQSLTSSGIWHDALRVNFRAAPDLFLWDVTDVNGNVVGQGKRAESWATALKYDANNVYLAALYGEGRN